MTAVVAGPWGELQPDMQAALAARPNDIEGVVVQLKEIQDVLKRIPPLFEENPIADFNTLYTTITMRIAERHNGGDFARPGFLNRLDVEFSRLYIRALRMWSERDPATPEAWTVLFHRVADTDLRSLPCAAAGVNAHVNFDLPFALMATWEALGHTPDGCAEHHDYLLINAVFEECIPDLRSRYLEGWQRQIDRINLGIDDWYQNLLVVLTRNVAWERAQRLWKCRAEARAVVRLREEFDTQAARIGRTLLSPFCRFIQ